MINKIEAMRADLRKSEKKVADLVLARPNMITNMSLADVAAKAGVSEPTVLRFCRGVGCSGFQDLKIRLVGDLARVIPYVHHDVRLQDPASDLAAKIFDRTISTLLRVKGSLRDVRIETAIDLLAEASKIEFYGLGASGIVADDAQNKFFRLGIPCNAYRDPHVQCMAASILKKNAAVVAISNSGSNVDLLHSVDMALKAGANVIAITRNQSPLAQKATVVLPADVPEESEIQTPMTSRIVHLLLIDVLQIGVALRRGPAAAADMERAKAGLKAKPVTPKPSMKG
ncbi:MAG: SIS domain-containing protein [Acidobacteriota bacterium]|nr:SIS domain-containing protein [Acidobacteriota bacterium]